DMRGRVQDFEMNQACAAGTGSFFDEAAKRVLDVLVSDLGDMAMKSLSPADLGEVCTVFMKSRIVQAQAEGYTPDDIAAGLAYSIARNYLNKVKGPKTVGRSVVFQGGVSNNKAVVAAFEALTGRPVEVPEHAEVMGAVGMALIAKARFEAKLASEAQGAGDIDLAEAARRVGTKFRGLSGRFIPLEVKEANKCGACANRCQLMHLKTAEGEKIVYGGGCDLHDRSIPKEKKKLSENLPDLLEARLKLLTKDWVGEEGRGVAAAAGFKAWAKGVVARAFGAAAPANGGVVAPSGRVIGFPAGLNFWESFPFWNAFFTSAGLEVTVSARAGKETLELAKRFINIDPCLPMKVIYGMVADLLAKEGVTDVFLPAVVELKPFDPGSKKAAPCPQVQGVPFSLKGVFKAEEHGKRFLAPELNLRGSHEEVVAQFEKFGAELGLSAELVRHAFAQAEKASEAFRIAQREEGAKIFGELKAKGKKGIVLLGRPYNALDSGLNLGIDREGRRRGWQALPIDFLPLESATRSPADLNNDTWYFQGKLLQAAEVVAEDPDLFPVYITNFRCGPDAFIIKQVEARMRKAGKPFLVLELDEHSSIAGYRTRLDAFITSIELAQEAAAVAHEKAETLSALAAGGAAEPAGLSFITLEELKRKKVFIPRMSDHSILLAGALRAQGIDARAFRAPTDDALERGRRYANGKECLPYPVVVGEALRDLEAETKAGLKPEDAVVMFTNSSGSCRFSQYGRALQDALHSAGFPGAKVANLAGKSKEPIVHNHFTPTLKLATGIWKAYLVGDYMHQLLLENRPYEVHTDASAAAKAELLGAGRVALGDFGERLDLNDPDLARKVKLADLIYEKAVREASDAIGDESKLVDVLERFARDMAAVPQDRSRKKPLIGVTGEIYVRWNDYANGDVLRQIEAQGGEAFLSPIAEYIYNGVEHHSPLGRLGPKEMMSLKGMRSLLAYFVSNGFLRWHDRRLFKTFRKHLKRPAFGRAMDLREVIHHGRKHTGGFAAGEGPLTLGAIEEFALAGADGAIMIGPMGCLPNTVYEGLIPRLKEGLPEGKNDFPVLTVYMSEARNLKNVRTRTEALLYQARQFMTAKDPR
ncbi:MAG: hypothetical protein HY553_18050, partial [Elusimicrobia bacterium]|nr:hypothetical protein [Elusimicrobiota bacterium]